MRNQLLVDIASGLHSALCNDSNPERWRVGVSEASELPVLIAQNYATAYAVLVVETIGPDAIYLHGEDGDDGTSMGIVAVRDGGLFMCMSDEHQRAFFCTVDEPDQGFDKLHAIMTGISEREEFPRFRKARNDMLDHLEALVEQLRKLLTNPREH
jgi:hypothetical protein